MRTLDELAQDARYAIRSLGRAPGFALATVSMLTLGIGLVAGGYSVANGLFVRPWPVPDSHRVVVAHAERREQPAAGRVEDGFSFGAYEHIRSNAQGADYVAMTRNYLRVTAQAAERPEGRVPEAVFATENIVDVLGIQLQRGTGLSTDGTTGARVLLSDALWRRRFDADPEIVGDSIWLAGEYPATVVGIMAPAFDSLGTRRLDVVVDLSAVTAVGRSRTGLITDPMSCCVTIAGRLRRGWTRERAREELQLLTAGYRRSLAQPELVVTLRDTTPDAEPGGAGRTVFVLIAAGLVLVFVLTCANVGNLYLARSLGRRSEIAVRLSLGASRARLVRQLLAEGLVMAAVAGAAAFLVTRSAPTVIGPVLEDTPASMFPADWRVAAVTTLAVMVACLLVALTPALQATRIAWRGASAMMSARAGRLRGIVLAAQIAIAAVLVLSAALLVRGIIHAASAPADYALHSTTMATVHVPAGRTCDAALVDRLARAAEASAVGPGVSVSLPGRLGLGRSSLTLPDGAIFTVVPVSLTRTAFDVLQVPLASGRWASDDRNAAEAVVNETLARRLAPVSEVLGQPFTLAFDRRTYIITGIVRDAHLTAFDQVDPMVFIPPTIGIPALLARTGPNTARQLAAIVTSVDPDLEVSSAPLAESARLALARARGGATIAGGLGVVALLLAIVGVGGVFSYLAEERRREIGIRLALGGSRARIAAALARACRGAVIGGLATGLLLSLLAGFGLRSFLFGLHPLDPISYGAVASVLLVSAFVATALPLRRALRVDPAVTLRAE